MKRFVAAVALLLAIAAPASAAPDVHLGIDNPAPKFGDTITVSWDFKKGGNGQENTQVWTVACYQDRETVEGVPYELQVWWVWTYAQRTFTLGETPVPGLINGMPWAYQIDNWVDGAAECEVYLYRYEYHRGMFTGYEEVAEYEFEVTA